MLHSSDISMTIRLFILVWHTFELMMITRLFLIRWHLFDSVWSWDFSSMYLVCNNYAISSYFFSISVGSWDSSVSVFSESTLFSTGSFHNSRCYFFLFDAIKSNFILEIYLSGVILIDASECLEKVELSSTPWDVSVISWGFITLGTTTPFVVLLLLLSEIVTCLKSSVRIRTYSCELCNKILSKTI